MGKVQDLDSFKIPKDFASQRPTVLWFIWLVFIESLVSSWLPGSTWRRVVLRMFGAKIGKKVLFKPRVRIKFPWRLEIGNRSWIGESVWIDNLDWVRIGSDVCISQGAYLCTGSHDIKTPRFSYKLGEINIEDQVWVCAMVKIGPSVRLGYGSVVQFGSIVYNSVPELTVVSGIPARYIRHRLK